MELRRHIVTAALAAGIALAARGQEQPPKAQIRVATVPPGAVIACDGIVRDTAPLTLAGLEAGQHLLTAQKQGHHEARRTVSLLAGQRLAIEIPLEPVMGLVLVHSTPAGAAVQVDGADRGETPLFMADLPIGAYRVRIASPGYLAKEIDLNIKDRTPAKIDARLVPDSATLVLKSRPEGARVTLNGIDRGITPTTLERIPGGEVTIELSIPGYEPHSQTVQLAAGQTEEATIDLKPLPAQLKIVSIPENARIYVDNQFRGKAPVSLPDLDPGTYRLRAELEGHDVLARTLELERAEQVVEEFRLQRNCGILELTTEPAGIKILIDGVDSGTTSAEEGQTDRVSIPLKVDLLKPGKHEVELAREGYFSKTFTINVERDKTLTSHQKLKRRFIPNYEVRTPTEVYQGVFLEADPTGDIKLEVRPGIIKTIRAGDIRFRGPLRERP